MAQIGIIDYQMGNLASLVNSLAKVGHEAQIVRDPAAIASFGHLILPGVGAFGDAMAHLKESGMDEALKAYAQSGRWLLGICLGLQVLFEKSAESPGVEGLGLIPGEVVRFDPAQAVHPIKIPHMGWNRTEQQTPSPLFEGVDSGERLYFVHTYHALCGESTIATACYGYRFTAAVNQNNLFGLQPHPEKSHNTGLKILKNFTELS